MEKEQRFQEMLESCPVMARYYNAADQTIDVASLREEFAEKSSGEKVMLAFLKVVWDRCGDWFEEINHFPILAQFARLDARNERIISQWTANPFWM